MTNESVNPWKLVTIGILLVGATAAATMLVIGRDSKTELPESQAAQETKALSETKISGIEQKTVPGRATERPGLPILTEIHRPRSQRAVLHNRSWKPVIGMPARR